MKSKIALGLITVVIVVLTCVNLQITNRNKLFSPGSDFRQGELYNFMNNEVGELVHLVNDHWTKYEPIARRYQTLIWEINDHYHGPVRTVFAPNYSPMSKDIIASSIVDSEGPVLTVYLSTLRDIYNRDVPNWGADSQRMFNILCQIAVIHELDHLASGCVLGHNGDHDFSMAARVNREKCAWAQTCKYTIGPLVESGLPVDPSHLFFYQQWVAAGRCDDCPAWSASITTAMNQSQE